MIEHQAVWVFWNNNKLVNADYLRECLDDGWIVFKSDLLSDEDWPDTVFGSNITAILKKCRQQKG